MRACNGVGRGYPCPLGEHTTTDVVIVCYNYHSAGLRVGGYRKDTNRVDLLPLSKRGQRRGATLDQRYLQK